MLRIDSTRKILGTTLAGALLLGGVTALSACQPEETASPLEDNPLAGGDDFVAIPRHPDAETEARRAAARGIRALPPADASGDFYLAIQKSALTDRWFLSAYATQWFPGGVDAGGAASLGTKVVSFRVEHDKLYVFDAGDGKATSSVFDPEILVEAYPIVHDPLFALLPGASQYVLVDPAAGLNHFGVVSDYFAPSAQAASATPFQIELSFLQRFRALADGVSFEQVFTGYTGKPENTGPLDTNAYQVSGTLAIALRRYAEGAGFHEVPAPSVPHYFLNPAQLDPADGSVSRLVAHWNIHPGMQPIKWLITPNLAAYVAAHPELEGVDVVAAVKRGIESWNQAFGFTVLRAEIAPANASFGDDERNFIIFDPSPAIGYAYADWRTNPNTGEIRGADVYFGAIWLDTSLLFDDEPDEDELAARVAASAPRQRLTWSNLGEPPLCALPAARGHGRSGESQLTAKQKLALIVEATIAHEIGHTLGLRHNFKGSLLPPSSSVMDYLLDDDTFATPGPQAYDVDAVKFLYGLAPGLPTQPFCTDENTATDPECGTFDSGADPLGGYWSDFYALYELLTFDLGYLSNVFFDLDSSGLLDFVRGGTPAQAAQAWERIEARLRPPVDPAIAADPDQAAAIDFTERRLVFRLFQQASPFSNIHTLPRDPGVLASAATDLGGVVRNLDGIRSIVARRQAVDVLKKLQRVEAYQALLDARAALAASLGDGTLAGTDLAYTTDLLARVDAAISPYFD